MYGSITNELADMINYFIVNTLVITYCDYLGTRPKNSFKAIVVTRQYTLQALQARHFESGIGKIVTISNISYKVIVTISDNQCTLNMSP